MNPVFCGAALAALVPALAFGQANVRSRHFDIVDNTRVVLHASNGTDATLLPDGQFLVAGNPIALTPAQQALLKDYHAGVRTLARDVAATAAAGTATAVAALAAVASSFVDGDSDKAEAGIDGPAARTQATALQACADLAALHEQQQTIAAQLPAFRPYARIDMDSVQGCKEQT